MNIEKNRLIPWFFWPFKLIWDLIEWVVRLTGRIAAAVIGLALVITGFILTIIVIAAPVGIPLMTFGFLLIIRGLF